MVLPAEYWASGGPGPPSRWGGPGGVSGGARVLVPVRFGNSRNEADAMPLIYTRLHQHSTLAIILTFGTVACPVSTIWRGRADTRQSRRSVQADGQIAQRADDYKVHVDDCFHCSPFPERKREPTVIGELLAVLCVHLLTLRLRDVHLGPLP